MGSPRVMKSLNEFLAVEARLTAQLSILGLSPFTIWAICQMGESFTMREVKGRSFQEYIQAVHQAVQHQSWQTTPDG